MKQDLPQAKPSEKGLGEPVSAEIKALPILFVKNLSLK